MTFATQSKATEAVRAAQPFLFLNRPFPLNSVHAGRGALSVAPVAVQEIVAETYVDNLARRAIAHQAVRHPYLEALAKGTLPDLAFALRDFARQYYAYSAHFPRYLTALISKLESPVHRAALMDNLTEESGQYGQEELDELAAIGIQP
jgi:hypothetical protein